MARHCYQQRGKRWYYKDVRCTDSIKRGKSLGTKLMYDPTKMDKERIDFLIKEFRKFGFRVEEPRTITSGARSGETYYYALRENHKSLASFMVSVSLTRYISNRNDLNEFYEYYILLRKKHTFVTTVKLIHALANITSVHMCSFSILERLRSRPDHTQRARTSGNSIFSENVNFSNYLTNSEKRKLYNFDASKTIFYKKVMNEFNNKWYKILKNTNKKQQVKQITKAYKEAWNELYDWLRSRGFSD